MPQETLSGKYHGKKLHLIILFLLCISCLFIRCDCCINCPTGHLRIWYVSPENGAIVYTDRVTLRWRSDYLSVISDSIEVYVHGYSDVYGDSHFRAPITEDDSTYVVYPLEPATLYSWTIRGSYTYWEDHYSHSQPLPMKYWSFTTADVLWEPGYMHSPTPDIGATSVSVNPSFAWEVYNPELQPFDFDIYLGTTTDPPLLVSGLYEPGYDLLSSALDYETLYYWRVEAYYETDTIESPLWEFTTVYSSDLDVYALFEIDAQQAPSGYHVKEEIRARFDNNLAIDAPIDPVQADSVFVGGTRLNWDARTQSYGYTEWSFPFITNGGRVDIEVYGNSEVPNLNTYINFPACTLSITSPETFGTVSISGFDLTWDGSECGGTVWLTVLDGTDSTGVWVETDNDGSYTLTAGDLAPLGGQTGTYNLAIIKLVEENISSSGYRPESVIRSRAFNVVEQVHIHDI